jgi:sugar/nucleoside kinase (ribokinase family)
MGDGFEKVYKDLAKYIDANKVKVGFNPGTFQLRKGVAANREILKRTELLILNKEEAQGWVGDFKDPEELCRKLYELGPRAIALTDGRKGAYSFSSEGYYYIPEFPGPRIEATGAGDSFATAYIAALSYGKSHQEALAWGPVNAGSVVLKIGPQEGLLSKFSIEQKLKKNKSFKAVIIADKKAKDLVEKMVANKKD